MTDALIWRRTAISNRLIVNRVSRRVRGLFRDLANDPRAIPVIVPYDNYSLLQIHNSSFLSRVIFLPTLKKMRPRGANPTLASDWQPIEHWPNLFRPKLGIIAVSLYTLHTISFHPLLSIVATFTKKCVFSRTVCFSNFPLKLFSYILISFTHIIVHNVYSCSILSTRKNYSSFSRYFHPQPPLRFVSIDFLRE